MQELYRQLGYEFKDSEILDLALTHRSVQGKNNERLEFLGDSLVNLIIAEELYRRFPSAKEGELSRLRANLVKGETLAALAREFSLGQYLNMGAGESKSGGANRNTILADAMEAIIAAIFIDSNMKTCQQCVLAWYKERFSAVAKRHDQRDPKTRLQEYLQSIKLPVPNYEVYEISGEAHAQVFHIRCQVIGLDHITEGKGSSRRRAEQEAAKQFLLELKGMVSE